MSDQIAGKDFLMSLQSIWEKNQKRILTVLGAVVVVIGGWYAYNEFFKKPKNEKAAEIIFKAEEYFRLDSSRKVLDGDGTYKGVLYVIKNNSGTPAANLAHYYAGISYRNLGEYNKAIEHLKEFSTSSKPVQAVTYGALGDCFGELGKKEDAAENYKKAGRAFTQDDALSAEYLWRAAQVYETMGKNKEALELYKEIKVEFPKAKQGEIDKYIYKLSIEKNDFSIN